MIELPLPPSQNHVYRTSKFSRRYMTAEGKKYKADAQLMIQAQGVRNPHDALSLIHYCFYWPDNRRRDTDNFLKVLKDCLTGLLYKDDCWQCTPTEVIENQLEPGNGHVVISWEL